MGPGKQRILIPAISRYALKTLGQLSLCAWKRRGPEVVGAQASASIWMMPDSERGLYHE